MSSAGISRTEGEGDLGAGAGAGERRRVPCCPPALDCRHLKPWCSFCCSLNLAATCKAAYQASRGWFVSKRVSVELVPAYDVNPPYTADRPFPWLHFLWAGSPQFECLLAWLDRFPSEHRHAHVGRLAATATSAAPCVCTQLTRPSLPPPFLPPPSCCAASVHFNVTDEDGLLTSMARLPSAATLSLTTFLPWREHKLPVSSISHLTALTKLILGEVSLHGSLEGLWQLTRLQQLMLELDNAQLSGSWEGMTRLSQLRDLHLSGLCVPLPALPLPPAPALLLPALHESIAACAAQRARSWLQYNGMSHRRQ